MSNPGAPSFKRERTKRKRVCYRLPIAMIPWETLDRVQTPDGVLILRRRGHDMAIVWDRYELMSTRSHTSEDALGTLGCAGLREKTKVRVVSGGLGMGFTLRAALDALGPDARVDVVDLVPEVFRWNRELLGDYTGHPLADPRVTSTVGNLADVIAAAHGLYDAILLDIDSGPGALLTPANARLYDLAGLHRTARALRPGGMFAVWSATEDPPFAQRLERAGFVVKTERVRAGPNGGRRHVLWLARRGSDDR